ncbi:Double-stranded RNA binding motif [Teratosphaeria destructans]|uniref:Large ribosomal subunit protein mL44 n=1 Tax=Teratosphaeria destructans TaxID=418781 RepID=A0A9W7SP61_9PEZI|nr:Double-stranded RNA binding motif [Teratosphaeria destructans]
MAFMEQLGHRSSSPLYAPSHRKAVRSAKLSALHARLSLPSKLPLQTLARCLIDPSADPRQGYNNKPFSILGQDLLGYYTSEYLLCRYPRLPMPVLFAAQYAYVGNATLAKIRSEWGVEAVAAPGTEVDAGLLQLKKMIPRDASLYGETEQVQNGELPTAPRIGTGRRVRSPHWRRGLSSRIVFDDEFGDLRAGLPDAQPYPGAPISTAAQEQLQVDDEIEEGTSDAILEETPQTPETDPTTLTDASAGFVRALTGALYLHAGIRAAKQFHRDHILSRHVPLHQLFNFTHPTRDISKLCAREGFEPPVARLISETGRYSRTPVYVVGVFSGEDKLGEAAGASLNEGRVRASAAAMRAWYLYSPPENDVVLPSEVEGAGGSRKGAKVWKPQMIDVGEVIT